MDQIQKTASEGKKIEEIYERVSQNVDFKLMANTTLLWVGTGASGPVIEQLVRLNIRNIHLFDNKRVRRKNLVAQNFTHDDIGIKKTEALRKRLLQCEFEKGNPEFPPLQVHTYDDFLALSDEELKKILVKEMAKGREVILVMSSDYHPAQARGNRMALKYGLTVFWVGIYHKGMAGEIIFYVPGHDLPCYRCITETRYQFFDKNRLISHLRGDYSQSARSFGLPFAATSIDAVLAHLIVGNIHSEIENNQHGKLFRRILKEKRNLIQCQLDPDYMLNDSENIFSQTQGPDQIAFNTIFQAEPRNHGCIDCHVPFGGRIWQNTDYTNEDYRKHLEMFSEKQSAIKSGCNNYKHPLLKTYADLFPAWENACPEQPKRS